MSCTRELPPWSFDLNILSSTAGYVWDPQWYPSTGVSSIDFLADARSVTAVGGAGPGVSLLPTLQFAGVRTDRPDAGSGLSTGSPIVAAGLTHYQEPVTSTDKFWFRRGFSFKLTGVGALFGTASVVLHTSYRSCGRVFPTRQVVVNPFLDAAEASWWPITGLFPLAGVDKAKAAIVGIDNNSSVLRWALGFRAFNDPMDRGVWTPLTTFAQPSPTTGSFEVNTNEVGFTGITLSNFQWGELAIGAKSNSGSIAARLIFHAIPALRYA
jgi:hypothetical protein